MEDLGCCYTVHMTRTTQAWTTGVTLGWGVEVGGGGEDLGGGLHGTQA